MDILLTTSIILIAIGYFVKWINKVKILGIQLNENNGFKFLLGWLIFGFFLRLDYSERWGCLAGLEPFWEPRNILFSTISIALIYSAYKTSNQRLKKMLCYIELIYWTLKLIIFKGGYVVGFGGVPDFTIVFYDFVSVLARLFVISQIVNIRYFKFLKIGLIALLIMGIKIEVFSTPPFMIYKENQAIKKAKEIRNEVIGKWKGHFKKLEYEKILSSGEIQIEIDSNLIQFKGVESLGVYEFNLDYSYHGSMLNKEQSQYYESRIEKIENDSLIFEIFHFGDEYRFRMKKESNQ